MNLVSLFFLCQPTIAGLSDLQSMVCRSGGGRFIFLRVSKSRKTYVQVQHLLSLEENYIQQIHMYIYVQ